MNDTNTGGHNADRFQNHDWSRTVASLGIDEQRLKIEESIPSLLAQT
jgi:hypothetical protein